MAPMHWKDGLRYTTTMHGELSVEYGGVCLMVWWRVNSWELGLLMMSHVPIHLDPILTYLLQCPMPYALAQRDVYRTVAEDLDLELTAVVPTIMMWDLYVLMLVSAYYVCICTQTISWHTAK